MSTISSLHRRLSDWHPKQVDSKNLDFLDGLRGVAILLVVFCHIVYTNPSSCFTARFLVALCASGSYGVVLFFCLSGFLVSLPFWKRKQAGKISVIPEGYTQRRLFKIYPPLFLSLAIITSIVYYKTGNLQCVKASVEWLLGLPLLFPVTGTVNNVMWSLIPEVVFYITLPVAMLIFRGVSMNTSIWLIPLLFFALGVISRSIYSAFGIYGSFYPVLYMPFLAHSDVFAMGVLVAGLYTQGFPKKSYAKLGVIGIVMTIIMLLITAMALFTGNLTPPLKTIINFIINVVFGLMLFLSADVKCFAARLLSNSLLRWFGMISYEWYLCHQVIFISLRETVGRANGSIGIYSLIVGGAFVISLLVAALVYKYFSLPILVYGRSLHRSATK